MIYKPQSLVITIYKHTIPDNKIIPNLNKHKIFVPTNYLRILNKNAEKYTQKRRLPKTWRLAKPWRMPNLWRQSPYCLGSAESATSNIFLVPLNSTFSSLLMLNRVHVVSKWGMSSLRPAFMRALFPIPYRPAVPVRHAQKCSKPWRLQKSWRPPPFLAIFDGRNLSS